MDFLELGTNQGIVSEKEQECQCSILVRCDKNGENADGEIGEA